MFFKQKEEKSNILNFVKIGALLIHAAKIDENFTVEEEEIIKKTLLSLGANENNLEKIFEDSKKSEENSNQILEFTKEVKNLDKIDKINIIKSLWKIIYSNKYADIYESQCRRLQRFK